MYSPCTGCHIGVASFYVDLLVRYTHACHSLHTASYLHRCLHCRARCRKFHKVLISLMMFYVKFVRDMLVCRDGLCVRSAELVQTFVNLTQTCIIFILVMKNLAYISAKHCTCRDSGTHHSCLLFCFVLYVFVNVW